MNILLIGDPHFKTDNKFETDVFVRETIDYIKNNKNNLDFIVIMGDILDTHEKIHIQPLCRANDFIFQISKIIKVYVLIGNHDRINNKVFLTDEHPFTSFKENSNVVIVDKTIKIDRFIFVPFVPNGRFKEALDIVDFNYEDRNQYIFAHQEFKGASLKNIISEKGDYWSKEYAPVFSGHIHMFQKPQDNIIYTGTPYQQSYHDDSKKSLILLKIGENIFDIERIFINTIQKKLLNLTYNDLIKFLPEKNILYKINLEIDDKNFKKIIKDKKLYDKLNCDNVIYKIKNIFEKKDYINSTKVKFIDILRENISKMGDKEKEIFQSVCSSS